MRKMNLVRGVALAALLLFFYLRERGQSERRAIALALIYAFATPIFFRSGFLNQNAILAHCTLAAWVLMVGLRPRAPGAPVPARSRRSRSR